MTTPATEKQINFIKKLDPTFCEFEGLGKGKASRIIGHLLNLQKQGTGAQAIVKAPASLDEVLASKDWNALYKAYNSFIEKDEEGWHGVNNLSDIGATTAQIKKYFSDIIKKEFPGLDFEIKASFKGWNNYIYITLLNVKYITFTEAATIANEHGGTPSSSISRCIFSAFQDGEKANNLKIEKYVYNNCIIKGYYKAFEGDSQDFLQDNYKKLVHFLESLLSSYSYNHSDIMTDYFSYGLNSKIETFTEESRGQGSKAFELLNDDDFIDQLEEITPEERQEIAQREEENQKRWTAYIAEQDAKEEAKKAERDRLYMQYQAEKAEALEHFEASNCDIYVDNCTTNDLKNSSIAEAHEGADAVSVCHIVKEINFTNRKAFELFASHLMDDWDFLERIGGVSYVDAGTLAPVDIKSDVFYGLYKYDLKEINILNVVHTVLIKCQEVPQFLVNTEGYTYARYIYFLPKNIEENTLKQTSTEAVPVPDFSELLTKNEKTEIQSIKDSLKFNNNVSIYNFKKAKSYSENFKKALASFCDFKINDGLSLECYLK